MAAEATLALLAPRAVSFLAETNSLRQQLSSLLEAEEEWSRAAAVLSGIDLDSGTTDANRERREADKLRTEVHIARLYLEDDDPAQAEAHVRRAAALVAGSADELLQLQYSTCHARVLDAQRRFLEASLAYYAVSKKVSVTDGDGNRLEQDEAEQQTALTQATTCAILAPAGPQRSRILATLYKDERCAKLPSYALLEKVHLERMLRPAEVESFTQTLRPHQMAVRGDGTRVHERAVVEHNLLAASTLYTNISFGELGSLLGTTAEAAESIAARMVIEDRMRASIDQVDGYIHFMPDVRARAACAACARASACAPVPPCARRCDRGHPTDAFDARECSRGRPGGGALAVGCADPRCVRSSERRARRGGGQRPRGRRQRRDGVGPAPELAR